MGPLLLTQSDSPFESPFMSFPDIGEQRCYIESGFSTGFDTLGVISAIIHDQDVIDLLRRNNPSTNRDAKPGLLTLQGCINASI
jgi:hypothetical protein